MNIHITTKLFNVIFSDNETTMFLSEDSSLLVEDDAASASTVHTSLPVSTGVPATRSPQISSTMSSESTPTSAATGAVISYTEPARHVPSRTYVLPHYHQPDSRWGPFFEEGPEPHNITARVGSTVVLDCRIGLLQDKMVSGFLEQSGDVRVLLMGRGKLK